MANCKDCGKDMSDASTNSCTFTSIKIGKKTYRRDTTYFDVGKRCHDCNIENKPGNYHHLGCDMERCPACKGQLISCLCVEFQGSISPEIMEQLKKETEINT